ncbi:MAG: TIGR01777 family protein [Chitinivibrionales bacterium]|nr:TIGR01777 family protein [Chitinivibrionales bacterium]
MKILISGATGLIGGYLVPHLQKCEHALTALTRSKAELPHIKWNPATGAIDPSQLEGFDAVIHLAGESIAGGRWTPAKKKRIVSSRHAGTRLLCETLASLRSKPDVLVSASGIGYYGDRGDETLTEASAVGNSFLSRVCTHWEESCESARKAGIRVVNLRQGVILTKKGGALQKMLLPFRAGAGGPIGDGKQYMSWIDIEDIVKIYDFALTHSSLEGAVNATAPHPVTNTDFVKTLGKAVHRPAVIPLPAFIVRLIFGELGEELLLAGANVLPNKLKRQGYHFAYDKLAPSLQHVLAQ